MHEIFTVSLGQSNELNPITLIQLIEVANFVAACKSLSLQSKESQKDLVEEYVTDFVKRINVSAISERDYLNYEHELVLRLGFRAVEMTSEA